MIKTCEQCLWKDQCGSDEVCEFFSPYDVYEYT